MRVCQFHHLRKKIKAIKNGLKKISSPYAWKDFPADGYAFGGTPPSTKCDRRGNPQALRHMPLKHACLPVPPSPRKGIYIINQKNKIAILILNAAAPRMLARDGLGFSMRPQLTEQSGRKLQGRIDPANTFKKSQSNVFLAGEG